MNPFASSFPWVRWCVLLAAIGAVTEMVFNQVNAGSCLALNASALLGAFGLLLVSDQRSKINARFGNILGGFAAIFGGLAFSPLDNTDPHLAVALSYALVGVGIAALSPRPGKMTLMPIILVAVAWHAALLLIAAEFFSGDPIDLAMLHPLAVLLLASGQMLVWRPTVLRCALRKRHPFGRSSRLLFFAPSLLSLTGYGGVSTFMSADTPAMREFQLIGFATLVTLATTVVAVVLARAAALDVTRRRAEKIQSSLQARLQQHATDLEKEVLARTQDLRETTERLDLALSSGSFGIWEWEAESGRVHWDERQYQLYGITPAAFQETLEGWWKYIHPEDLASLKNNFERANNGEGDFDHIHRIRRPDGAERIIESHVHVNRDNPGQLKRIIGIDHDITADHERTLALATANDRLQLIVKAAGYGVWEMDLASEEMSCDEHTLEIYGIAEGQLAHSSDWRNFVLPEDAALDDERLRQALTGEAEIYESAFRIRRPDGEIRHIEALGVIQRDIHGHPLRLIGLDRDSTEPNRLREELRVSEERWQLAISSNNDGVWDWDIESGQCYRDPRFAAIIGLRPEDMPPDLLYWKNYSHPDDIPLVEKILEAHLRGYSPLYECEHRLRHASGHWVWVLARGKVVHRDDRGQPLRLVGTITDITQRRETEERLRRSEEMSLQLSHLAQIGAWELDLATGQITWTPEVYRIHEVELGFEPSLANIYDFYPPESRLTIEGAMRQAMENGLSFDLELSFITGSRQRRWVRNLGRVQIKDGRPTRVHGAFQDITGRHDAEEMRRQLEGQLFQAQKMETLGTLAGGIAHDFNNLLTGILGYQDLALDSLIEADPARNYLSSAREASLRARELIDQILTFSRQSDTEHTSISLTQVIEDARRFLRATVPTAVQIEVEVAQDCKRVLADPTQIHQVLLNLGSNSAHAMRNSGGVIRISARPANNSHDDSAALAKLTPGDYVRLDFSDTGHGIDVETLKRVFDPFFTTKEVGQGTGLGLSVVHGIIEAHKGAITVSSTVGEGTTFSIFLPVAHKESDDFEDPKSSVPRGQGELIAMVDDEDIVRSFAQMALEKFGYRVASFDSASDCLEVLRRNPGSYSALLTDQTMPIMKGIELAAAVRKFSPHLPIVIMSGYFSRILPETLAEIGHGSLLSKPFTNDELARAVHRAINSNKNNQSNHDKPN